MDQASNRRSVVYSAVRPGLGSQENKHLGKQLVPEITVRQGQRLEEKCKSR